jgi:L,D-peptidoglycan transpeptidase YkuD (ErfK/YbiS/YcfS/YnhG family)
VPDVVPPWAQPARAAALKTAQAAAAMVLGARGGTQPGVICREMARCDRRGLLLAVTAVVVVASACGGGHSRSAAVAVPSVTQGTTSAPTTATTVPATAAAATTTAPGHPATTQPRAALPATCAANLAGQLASTGAASQLITVDAPVQATTSATLTTWQRSGKCWVVAGGPWSARLGYNGISDHHNEGDGTTPSGAYGIGPVVYGNGPNPGVHYLYHPLVCGDWWDEDPSSPQYNTFQHVTCGTVPPFGGNSENLRLPPKAYQNFAFIEYNTSPVVPGRGSAVFLHDDVGGPTNGCISLPPSDLATVLRWLQPTSGPLIVIGSDAEIRRF